MLFYVDISQNCFDSVDDILGEDAACEYPGLIKRPCTAQWSPIGDGDRSEDSKGKMSKTENCKLSEV